MCNKLIKRHSGLGVFSSIDRQNERRFSGDDADDDGRDADEAVLPAVYGDALTGGQLFWQSV